MKYRDQTLQPPLRLSAHILEGKPKVLRTCPKTKNYKLLSHILCILQTLYSTCDYVEQNCHVLVTVIYNLNLASQHIKLKENFK